LKNAAEARLLEFANADADAFLKCSRSRHGQTPWTATSETCGISFIPSLSSRVRSASA
jgi:hypothetical protein